MHLSWSKTNYSPIAIDFGADSLKLLQVVLSNPPQLVMAAAAILPEEARANVTARQGFYATALKKLLKERSFKGRAALCSIPAYQTLVQQLQIARGEGEDLDTQISMELRQRLNVDTTRMVVRHFEVAQSMRDGAAKQELICLAASREAVMRHVELARAARLDVVGMESEPLAIIKAFGHLYRNAEGPQRITCFIDIGAATTKVVIAHGSEMTFAKIIHAAGDHLTRQHASSKGISFDQARSARHEAPAAPGSEAVLAHAPAQPRAVGGLAILEARMAAEQREAQDQPTDNVRARLPGGAPSEGGGDPLDCLIDELQLSLRYHQSLFPQRPVEKLVFLGGEARQVSTCQRIARALRIGAQLGDPLARMVRVSQTQATLGVDLRQPQPGWAVPLGLCLSEASVK